MANFDDDDDDFDPEDNNEDNDEGDGEDAYDFIIALLGNGGIVASDPEFLGRNALRHQMGGSQIY